MSFGPFPDRCRFGAFGNHFSDELCALQQRVQLGRPAIATLGFRPDDNPVPVDRLGSRGHDSDAFHNARSDEVVPVYCYQHISRDRFEGEVEIVASDAITGFSRMALS